MGLVSVAAAPSPAAPLTEAAGPVAEREGQVLAAVRALGRPTAREVAGHTGLPNGSVAVALRALGARGLVARAESGRGIEYTLPPAASWA
jgi:DNA-binding IclR family transcriptional regulator